MQRLSYTNAVEALLDELQSEQGPLILYQSGGCCEGSSPLCVKKASFRLRKGDVLLGSINGVEYWVDKAMFALWKNLHFTLNVQHGRGSNEFSLESLKERSFLISNRLFTATEIAQLDEITIHHG